jgi:recombination protein RecT
MPPRQERQTVSGAVAQRRGEAEQQQGELDPEQRIIAATEWFRRVAPSHINPDQYVALCLNLLRKDRKLQLAAVQNPESLMVAARECAQDGLIPGVTYHFVPFKDGKASRETGRDVYVITGIRDYKGEIELIYRSGEVSSVICNVVRANDSFAWRPGVMQVPHHVIHAPQRDDLLDKDPKLAAVVMAMREQEGLADDDERGPLTGTYAYARRTDGSVSDVIVMSMKTVLKHRPPGAPAEFWGPGWPLEGPHTPNMWLKTGLHVLYDRVPHSAEYVREKLRAVAEAGRETLTAVPPVQRRALATAPALTAGEPAPPAPEEPPDLTPRQRINAAFKQAGVGGKDQAGVRRAVMTRALAPEGFPIDGYADLTSMDPDQLTGAAESLEEFLAGLGEDADVRDLVTLADAVDRQVAEAQQEAE